MGYRSEVALTLTKQDAIRLLDEATNASETSMEFLEYSKLIKHSDEYVTLYWDWVKWYDGYEDVDFVNAFCSKLLDEDRPYAFKRIGEDNEDYESFFNGDYAIDECVEFARRFETDWNAETTVDELRAQ